MVLPLAQLKDGAYTEHIGVYAGAPPGVCRGRPRCGDVLLGIGGTRVPARPSAGDKDAAGGDAGDAARGDDDDDDGRGGGGGGDGGAGGPLDAAAFAADKQADEAAAAEAEEATEQLEAHMCSTETAGQNPQYGFYGPALAWSRGSRATPPSIRCRSRWRASCRRGA